MANTIILKKSGVDGKAPVTSDISLGEIAINYKNGFLFYRDNESSPAVHKINAGNADTTDGFHLNQNVLTTSTPTFDKLRLTNGSDASLTSTDHAFQVGASSGQNLVIDNNEIVSRSNGTASTLYLQNDGGDVRLGSNGGTTRLFLQDGSVGAPAITFNNDTNTGIYRSDADRIGFSAGGGQRAYIDANGITAQGNVYASADFRNYSNVWKASAGVTGNGFEFNNSVDGTALTISSTGDTVASGKITSGNDIVNATAGVYTWVGDTDTYIQRSAGNEITIKTGASNALVLDSSQNATFAGNVLAPTFLAGQSAQYNPTGGGTTKATLTANAASRTQLVISNQTNNASASAALVLATHGHDFFVKGGSLAGGSKLTLGFNTNNFLELTSSSATFAGSVAAPNLTLTNLSTYSGSQFTALMIDGSTVGKRDLGSNAFNSTAYLPLAGGDLSGNVKFNDNAELRLGSGADLKLYHNGTTNNSNIENNVGGLYITNYADDSDIVFRSDDGSGGIAEYFRLAGNSTLTYFSKPLQMADSQKIFAGNGGDLQIYHNGTHSYLTNNITGSLYIQSGNSVQIESSSGENMIVASANGAVELYHDNVKKFETFASGISVTGSVNADQLHLGDNDKALFGNSNDLQIYHDGSHSYIRDQGTGNLIITGSQLTFSNVNDTEYMAKMVQDGTVELYYDGSKKFETTSTGVDITGHLSATTKSFLVDNPKTGGKLQYGVVESNEHGVYVRGKTDQDEIELPEEWEWLVDEDSVTVDLTSIGQMQHLFIIEQTNKKVKVGGMATNGQYNYVIYGTRKDVDPLEINI